MKLLQLTCQAIRGVPDGSYSFAAARNGVPLDCVVVTGGPGSGKTSLLEAIAAIKEATGSYGLPPDGRRMLRRGMTAGRIEATWLLSTAELSRAELEDARPRVSWEIGDGAQVIEIAPRLRRLVGRYSVDPEIGKFELFSANRRISAEVSSSRSPRSPAEDAHLRLTSERDKYTDFRLHLRALALSEATRLTQLLDTQGIALRTQQPDALAPFKEAIAALLPDLRLAAVELEDRMARIWFQRRDGARVELDELSESEQQAVLFAVTFRRLGLNHSVILIDTPELHLHPRCHAAFFAGLLELGRDNQIIAATTSAELCAAARPEQVIDLAQP
jgi:energy-coupling factor transporter ATP-binding protein EcfA2